MIGRFTQHAQLLATREASFYFLCKCDISTPLLMCLTKSICWEFICLPCSQKDENLSKKRKQRKTEKLPSPVLKCFPYTMKI